MKKKKRVKLQKCKLPKLLVKKDKNLGTNIKVPMTKN